MKTKILFAVILVMVAAMTVAPEVSAQEQGEEYTLEEITVTATKRETALEDTALALSVVTGDMINEQGRNNLVDVLKDIPGLNIDQPGNGGEINIRGVAGAVAIGEGHGDPAVAMNVDGIYNSSLVGLTTQMNNFYDMARVEVLRGPQGTLYGRNAEGGVVNLISSDPSNKLEASGTIELGSYHLLRGTGMVNAPLTEHTALRIAFNHYDRDSYFSNDAGAQGIASGRVKYLYHPSDAFRLLIGGEFSKQAGARTGASTYAYVGGKSPVDPYDNLTKDGGITGSSRASGSANLRSAKVWAQIDWETPIGTVTYIPSYNESVYRSAGFSKVTGHDYYQPTLSEDYNDQNSFEARLASSGESAFDYVLGIFYLHAKKFSPDDNEVYKLQQTSEAVFGQGTYHITDSIRGTLGLRYTKDTKGYFASKPEFGTGIPASGDKKWTRIDWKAGLDMDISEDSLVYLDVATGYRPGSVNSTQGDTALDAQGNLVPSQRFTKPETLLAYEMGVKTSFFDKRLTVNADVYFNDYTDRQYMEALAVPAGVACPNGLRGVTYGGMFDICFAERNMNKAETYGGELSSIMRPTDNDNVNLSVAYLRAYVAESQLIYFTGNKKVDINGLTLPSSPKWQVNLSWEHRFDFETGSLFLRGDGRYQADSYLYDFSYLDPAPVTVRYPGFTRTYSCRDLFKNNAHTLYDFTATYMMEAHYTITAYVKNIFETYYRLHVLAMGTSPTAEISDPRTYGITFTARF